MQGAVAAVAELHEPTALVGGPSQPPPSPSSSSRPHKATLADSPSTTLERSKRERVLDAAKTGDVSALRELASEPGGFEDQELRRAAWPVLLRCDLKGKGRAVEEDETSSPVPLANLPARDDERQVRLDIVRSLVNYPEDVKEEDREPLRTRLETAILTVLRRHPALQYFQGYHDIVSVFLLALDDDDILIPAVERLSLHYIRDSMGSGLEPTLGYLKLVHRLAQKVDPELHGIVNQAASMPFFALSWALTLLAHDLESVAVIARIFDFLLAHEPSMIIYLVVAILVTKKDDLAAIASTVGEEDPAMIHSALSQLPNIVLHSAPSTPLYPSPPQTPTSPSPARRSSKAAMGDGDSVYDEDLMSSASLAGSSSTSNLTDLTLSPTLTASTSTSSATPADLSESLISVSEASPSSSSGLRQRRGRVRSFSLADSFGSFDDDIHALDDSMLADPDCDLGFASFPSAASSARVNKSSRSRTPSPPRTPSRSSFIAADGEVLRPSSPFSSPSQLPPPRPLLVDDLLSSALSLSLSHPLSSLKADEVLGPSSCLFTYACSLAGALSDSEAEEIVRLGGDAVVLPGAAIPDAPADADEYEIVDSPNATSSSSSSRRKKSSFTVSAAGGGRLNLGPHGWLVLGGAAVATAAVAYGVYKQQGGVGGVGGAAQMAKGASGLGTAGVGLGTAGGLGLGAGVGILGGAGLAGLAGGGGRGGLPPPPAAGASGLAESVEGRLI
ncbi:hypothetical protein JCM6882_007480 [Rhodosporidiobolus microsporus]